MTQSNVLWNTDEPTIRNHFIAMAGEFAGTFLFLFFAFTSTQVANSQTQGATSTTIAQGQLNQSHDGDRP